MLLQAVYYYLRFALSYRDIEDIYQERNVPVDHATIQRWVIKYSPSLEREYRKKKPSVGSSWRMDASGTRKRILRSKVFGIISIVQ